VLETFAARLNDAKTEAATGARNLREEIQSVLKLLGEGVSARILGGDQGERRDSCRGACDCRSTYDVLTNRNAGL
jgi:hypothetical protein